MKKSFQVFAYVFMIVVGAYMFGFTADGKIIKICIACNSLATNVLALVSMVTGVIGFIGAFSRKEANVRTF